jgi:hypothetical protein
LHEPFRLGALPLLAMRRVADGVASADLLLALSRVSRALRAATSEPALWDKFCVALAPSSVADGFRLTPRQKLSLARAQAQQRRGCESCSAEVAAFPSALPCCLCARCADARFVAREALTSAYAVAPAALEGLRHCGCLFVRADVERSLGRTLEQHAAAVKAAKQAEVLSAALRALAKGPMPRVLASMDSDVERAMAASNAVTSMTAGSRVDACVARVLGQLKTSRIQAAVALVFGGHDRSLLHASTTLSQAVRRASVAGCLDDVAAVSIATVLSEAARSRNAGALKASIARVVAQTGLPARALASLRASDDLDPGAAKKKDDQAILGTIREQLMGAPGKFAGHEDARYALWCSIDAIYADGAELLESLISAGSLDDVVSWFAERNLRANLAIRGAVSASIASHFYACPLCIWSDHGGGNNKVAAAAARQRVWEHLRSQHGLQ